MDRICDLLRIAEAGQQSVAAMCGDSPGCLARICSAGTKKDSFVLGAARKGASSGGRTVPGGQRAALDAVLTYVPAE